MTFKITFDTGNAAFTDGNGPHETARILRNIAARVEYAGEHIGQVHDINGNRIGSWSASFPTDEDDTP